LWLWGLYGIFGNVQKLQNAGDWWHRSSDVFGMLKFTKIGQSNYQINRMRTGLDPNDPSLQLRLINQAKLRGYLASRPIGGGIGSAGFWGTRFSPGTFLAVTALDSWYVKIWAECGVVGLYVHVGMLLTFMIYFGLKLWKIPPVCYETNWWHYTVVCSVFW
jgi:hypothetical protein